MFGLRPMPASGSKASSSPSNLPTHEKRGHRDGAVNGSRNRAGDWVAIVHDGDHGYPIADAYGAVLAGGIRGRSMPRLISLCGSALRNSYIGIWRMLKSDWTYVKSYQ